MAATQHDTRLNPRKLLPALALATGLIAAALVAAAPAGVFDAAVEGLPLPAFVPAGMTGRMLAAIAVGGVVAALGALPLLAPRRRRATRLGAIPLLRRADAHPDAPARRPIAAHSELGAPVLLIDARTAEHGQPIPADLDQPLAAFDPGAVPAVPRAPVRAVRSLAPVRRARIEAFPVPAGEGEASIGALLDRLERAAARRAAARIDGLEDMLVKLRKLAAG
ncbi:MULTISPECIES: hypothetical protein [unclassified Sphingomonas]|uniref:hypothetical protein n=1 Tax=unclassified Sphingomonas TaxID=196159 RepID=UPI000925C8AE|nr:MULTISPECIES: hypothetical protein [unclassified Sphingomonas]OJU15445.1 MAG: hypothetical protein BGN95_24260 [Sphingomonas sp. 66-10]